MVIDFLLNYSVVLQIWYIFKNLIVQRNWIDEATDQILVRFQPSVFRNGLSISRFLVHGKNQGAMQVSRQT